MEFITYQRKNPEQKICNFNYVTEKWYGGKSFLRNLQDKEFADNTLTKQTLLKSLKETKLKTLKRKHESASIKAKIAKERYETFQKYQNSLTQYHSKTSSLQIQEIQMNLASIKIQKVVRGYLTRKFLEGKIINYSKKLLNNNISSLQANDTYLLLFIGKKPLISVQVLQRFFRKTLFKMKISRLQKAFFVIQEQKKKEISRFFSKYMRTIYSNFVIKEKSNMKRILEKLQVIKERLAIIRIKQLLRKKKLKFKMIRHRVKRYSKKHLGYLSLPINRSTSTITPFMLNDRSSGSKLSIRPVNEEEIVPILPLPIRDTSMDANSAISETTYQVDPTRTERIAKSLISYNVKSKNSLKFFPFFLENDPDSRPQTTKSTISRINLIKPLRLPPAPLPNPQKSKPLTSRVKSLQKYTIDDFPPYMNDTKNSILRYEETPSPEPIPKSKKKIILKTSLLHPTFSFTQRTKSSEIQIVQRPSSKPSRPATGPHLGRRKIVKNTNSSELNITQHNFDPPLCDITELETQSIRPFFVRIRPVLERLKRQQHRSADFNLERPGQFG